jgi:hypothetical protein
MPTVASGAVPPAESGRGSLSLTLSNRLNFMIASVCDRGLPWQIERLLLQNEPSRLLALVATFQLDWWLESRLDRDLQIHMAQEELDLLGYSKENRWKPFQYYLLAVFDQNHWKPCWNWVSRFFELITQKLFKAKALTSLQLWKLVNTIAFR